ncbi:AAA family ATPase [Solimonas sp. K1W22B-7]|uniref:AAA family ATPase n=1 Tax=Solimonas sp. K1W22B-7 TaxID=2303331 RepID=UPI000E32FF4D|nr:AAA family ATPase [Solimonas sp. K1W22B-7]AXQ28943.1 AAA family ATPase [Solimonas sp. K1W22B-7]
MNQPQENSVKISPTVAAEWFSLVHEGCAGQSAAFRLRVSRIISRLRREKSPLADVLAQALAQAGPAAMTMGRDYGGAGSLNPLDADTRLPLTVTEYPVVLPSNPIWSSQVESQLNQLLREWKSSDLLYSQQLHPSRTLLLSGPPGTGKSMTAKFLAHELDVPLLTLNLAAAVNSYLGKTGVNLARVLDHGRRERCVLFLDEFDALAKRRDDAQDVGELKRVVNVLLQAVDDWPSTSLLIAATNHVELLDKAVFRRFDMWVQFPSSSSEQFSAVLERNGCPPQLAHRLGKQCEGRPLSDAVKLMERARRRVALDQVTLSEAIGQSLEQGKHVGSDFERATLAAQLRAEGLSQREIAAKIGTSHSTVNRLLKLSEGDLDG